MAEVIRAEITLIKTVTNETGKLTKVKEEYPISNINVDEAIFHALNVDSKNGYTKDGVTITAQETLRIHLMPKLINLLNLEDAANLTLTIHSRKLVSKIRVTRGRCISNTPERGMASVICNHSLIERKYLCNYILGFRKHRKATSKAIAA